jgi:hypothetical protein
LAYASAREAFLLLFGQGLNDAEARDLIDDAGPLFAEAAFAAAQRGESETALALANEGRARLLGIALKLQALGLPAEKSQRLAQLREAIRTEQRAVEATQGIERAAAVEKLVGLRQELLELVKGATANEGSSGSAQAQAQAIIAKSGGAVVVPVITKTGSKILIVTVAKRLTVLDLPDLTTDRLKVLMRGDGKAGGWIGAYAINYLNGPEKNERWPEWLTAVGDLGPQLWQLFGARLDERGRTCTVTPPGGYRMDRARCHASHGQEAAR